MAHRKREKEKKRKEKKRKERNLQDNSFGKKIRKPQVGGDPVTDGGEPSRKRGKDKP